MKNTKIEWATHTVNVAPGCTPVVADDPIAHPSACERCYAARMAARLASMGQTQYAGFRVHLRPDRLPDLLKGKPGDVIMVESMGDIAHDDVPDNFIAAIFAFMNIGQQLGLRYVVITKRIQRLSRLLQNWSSTNPWLALCIGVEQYKNRLNQIITNKIITEEIVTKMQPVWPIPNVLIMATTESQYWFDRRINDLLQCPADLRGISVEGMLGPVDPCDYLDSNRWTDYGPDADSTEHPALDWVICGPENGPKRRPFELDWARELRRRCYKHQVPFFFKPLKNDEHKQQVTLADAFDLVNVQETPWR